MSSLSVVATLLVPDVANSRALEDTVKAEAGRLDMLATCSSVAGGTRWYILRGPSFVNRSRAVVLCSRLAERHGIGASLRPD